MKKLLFILLIVFNCQSNAQQNLALLDRPVEIFLFAFGPQNENTTFIMDAVSQVWAGRTNNTYYSGSYNWLSSDYEYLSHSAINNQGKSGASGWQFVTIPEEGIDIFGYGKYKLTVEGKYFYLDYRDDRIGYYGDFGPSTGHAIDIYIKYDHYSEELSINSYNDESHWLGISQNTTINIWELKGMGEPSKAKFEPYAPENLSINLSSGKPLLN